MRDCRSKRRHTRQNAEHHTPEQGQRVHAGTVRERPFRSRTGAGPAGPQRFLLCLFPCRLAGLRSARVQCLGLLRRRTQDRRDRRHEPQEGRVGRRAVPGRQVGGLEGLEAERRQHLVDQDRNQHIALTTDLGLFQHPVRPDRPFRPDHDDTARAMHLGVDHLAPGLADRDLRIPEYRPAIALQRIGNPLRLCPVVLCIADEDVTQCRSPAKCASLANGTKTTTGDAMREHTRHVQCPAGCRTWWLRDSDSGRLMNDSACTDNSYRASTVMPEHFTV